MSIISKYSLPSPGSLHWDSIHDSWPQSVSGGHVSAVARDHMWWLGPGQYTCSACCHISPPATCAAFFLCVSACFTILSSLMNPFPHTSQLNGFSPVWRHMWRRRSVLWLNCFGQTSHLYGLSPACLAKCSWNIQNWISDFTIFYIITIYSIFQFFIIFQSCMNKSNSCCHLPSADQQKIFFKSMIIFLLRKASTKSFAENCFRTTFRNIIQSFITPSIKKVFT